MSKDSSLHRSSRSTMLVSMLTMASRLLGFVRTFVISYIFGSSGVADVINLTFNVPNNLRKLLAEGALSAAFIPVLSETIVKDDGTHREPRRLVRNILSFQLIILIPLCILCFIFSRPIVAYVLSDFDMPWQINLSGDLFRWMILYLLFISVSAVLMGSINSHNRFFVPAVTPPLFSVCVISSLLLLHRSMGPYAMVVGILLGGAAQVLFQTPLFVRLEFDFKLGWDFSNPYFKRIMKQWGPVVITSSVFTVTQMVALRFASALEEGSVSAMTYSVTFWQLPMGIFASSITTVLFPRMSRQAAEDNREGLKESLQHGIRFLMVFLVPSAVFLGLYGTQTIAIALQRGEFSAENTYMIAKVLSAYSLGLLGVGIFNFSQRFFYAQRNYKLPFWVALGTAVLDIILSVVLKETSLRVSGLALANSLSFSLGGIVFLLLAWRKLGGIGGKRILITLAKTALPVVALAVFLLFYRSFTGDLTDGTPFLPKLTFFMGAVAGSAVIVLGGYKVMKIEMVNHLLKRRS